MYQVREIIRTIFWSYTYNREISYMLDLYREVRDRVTRSCNYLRWTDDGNIIYGMIVLLWGNYGTSPRGGWLEDYIPEIIKSIDELIEEFKEMEKEENKDAE